MSTTDAIVLSEGNHMASTLPTKDMAAFAFMAWGRYADKELEHVKRNLFEYCKQDTLAMVKLQEKLYEYV